MSRVERLEQYLRDIGPIYGSTISEMAQEILTIAVPPRGVPQMMNTQDVARRLRRPANTIVSWRVRDQYDFPPPAGHFGSGAPYWSQDVIELWAATHSELLGPE